MVINVLCLPAFVSVHSILVVTCSERANLLDLVYDILFCFYRFPSWYPRPGVLLDCINS